ncbi:A24 family peptidase [Lignipirellula cremea]|uniref:Type IV leader peptidase family protein n=1 Tax=Lignipirellula cremea TaxID=2528010 RepID=A0A518E0T5_9BACT|nr:prepilin peptidase [Lignipirellula cremea]QDU97693.1 hypothetical protein Pla8534_55460 [Lignipirellula cremea]
MPTPADLPLPAPAFWPAESRRKAWLIALCAPLLTVPLGAGLLWNVLPYPWGTATGLTFAVFLLVCLWTDSVWHKVFNWATYPALGWALLLNVGGSLQAAYGSPSLGTEEAAAALTADLLGEVVGPVAWGTIGLAASLLGAGCLFGLMTFISMLARCGGGDIKMATVMGAFLGWRTGVLAICLGYLLAGLASLGLLLWHVGLFRLVRFAVLRIGYALVPMLVVRPQLQADALLRRPIPVGAYFSAGSVLAQVSVLAEIVWL